MPTLSPKWDILNNQYFATYTGITPQDTGTAHPMPGGTRENRLIILTLTTETKRCLHIPIEWGISWWQLEQRVAKEIGKRTVRGVGVERYDDNCLDLTAPEWSGLDRKQILRKWARQYKCPPTHKKRTKW